MLITEVSKFALQTTSLALPEARGLDDDWSLDTFVVAARDTVSMLEGQPNGLRNAELRSYYWERFARH